MRETPSPAARRSQLWLYILACTAFVLCALGIVWAAYGRVELNGSGNRLILANYRDDFIYNSLVASGEFCRHNLTTAIPEGGCRINLIWSFTHLLYFNQSVALAGLLLRTLLFGLIATALHVFARRWSRAAGLPEGRARLWLFALAMTAAYPLILVAPRLDYHEFSVFLSLISSPPNLFSALAYLVVFGGYYLGRHKPSTWPIWGGLAGIWLFIHPYFVYQWVSLVLVWAYLDRRTLRDHWGKRLLLLVPSTAAMLYYLWLARVNQFFRFHLGTNVTRYPLSLLIVLVVTLVVYGWLSVRIIRRGTAMAERSTLRPDGYLLSWAVVVGVWQLVPIATQIRGLLLLSLPLALLQTQLVIRSGVRSYTRLLLGVVALNCLLLLGSLMSYERQYLGPDTRQVTLTSEDRDLGLWLGAPPQKQEYFVGTETASSRFMWLSQTHIVNTQQHESQYFPWWHELDKQVRQGAGSCDKVALGMNTTHASGEIAAKFRDRDWITFMQSCGAPVRFENASWVVTGAPAAR